VSGTIHSRGREAGERSMSVWATVAIGGSPGDVTGAR
jgi:hypothetical protein